MQGYYGVVYKGEYRKHPKGRIRPVAIKCLHAKMYEDNAASFEHEIKVCKWVRSNELKRPWIVFVTQQVSWVLYLKIVVRNVLHKLNFVI